MNRQRTEEKTPKTNDVYVDASEFGSVVSELHEDTGAVKKTMKTVVPVVRNEETDEQKRVKKQSDGSL
jgi:hypothetical protein